LELYKLSQADEYSDSLHRIALSLTAQREERAVIRAAVDGLVGDFGAALARIWISGPPGRSRHRSFLADGLALRLKAERVGKVDMETESGREMMAGDWIRRVAETHESLTTSRLYHGGQTPDAPWMRENRFRAFAAHALMDGDTLLGVLAVFTQFPITDRTKSLLGVFAGLLAAEIRDCGRQTPAVPASQSDIRIPAGSSLDSAMRIYIEAALKASSGRIEGVGGAADALCLHPNTLRSRMTKLGIRRIS
jgi:DNA-binding NtrC family response regulator